MIWTKAPGNYGNMFIFRGDKECQHSESTTQFLWNKNKNNVSKFPFPPKKKKDDVPAACVPSRIGHRLSSRENGWTVRKREIATVEDWKYIPKHHQICFRNIFYMASKFHIAFCSTTFSLLKNKTWIVFTLQKSTSVFCSCLGLFPDVLGPFLVWESECIFPRLASNS